MNEKAQCGAPVVLVVEDEALIRLLAVDLLEEEGFSVLEAANAANALQVLEKRSDVSVLFTDIQMPGEMNGLDLAARVHEKWPNIRLLLTSGMPPTRREIPNEGWFIPKPYDLNRLKEQVGKLAAM